MIGNIACVYSNTHREIAAGAAGFWYGPSPPCLSRALLGLFYHSGVEGAIRIKLSIPYLWYNSFQVFPTHKPEAHCGRRVVFRVWECTFPTYRYRVPSANLQMGRTGRVRAVLLTYRRPAVASAISGACVVPWARGKWLVVWTPVGSARKKPPRLSACGVSRPGGMRERTV
jgi:hypothetical protein